MNTESEWLVRLNQPYELDEVQILIAERRGRDLYVVKPMSLVTEVRSIQEPLEPSLRLPQFMAQPFLAAMADMLHKQKIRPTIQGFVEGELTATKQHLDDMRKLVFRR